MLFRSQCAQKNEPLFHIEEMSSKSYFRNTGLIGFLWHHEKLNESNHRLYILAPKEDLIPSEQYFFNINMMEYIVLDTCLKNGLKIHPRDIMGIFLPESGKVILAGNSKMHSSIQRFFPIILVSVWESCNIWLDCIISVPFDLIYPRDDGTRMHLYTYLKKI